MPAERAGSSPGAQGKAIPVDQTAGQLRLPIATAENPEKGPLAKCPRTSSGTSEAGVPEAIVNAESVTPVTMEEVVSRLSAALLKVVSNKGAPGPDGLTVGELLSSGRLLARSWPPPCWMGATDLVRRAGWRSRRQGAGSAGWGSRQSRIGSRRRLWPCSWSRWWSRGSTRTPMATVRTSRPTTRSRRAGSGAGSTTGRSISMSGSSSTRCRGISSSRRWRR